MSMPKYIWTQNERGTKKQVGRSRALSETQIRGLIRHKYTGNYNVRKLRDPLTFPVTSRTIIASELQQFGESQHEFSTNDGREVEKG